MTDLPPPVEKLPLAIRKNFRDNWESSKKGEVEQQISDLLGEKWTVTTNPNQIYAMQEDESYKSRPGEVMTWYMDGFLSGLKDFISKFGEDGKAELNSLCSKHQVELAPQGLTKYTYGGLEVLDGVLRLVFARGNLGVNCSNVSQDFAGPLKAAAESSPSASALDIIARQSIAEGYDKGIEEIRAKIGKQTGVADIKVTPLWDENAKLLKVGKGVRDDWNKILGPATLDYYDNFARNMQWKGFADDDMLQEGFQEAVDKNEICFRIVEKMQGSGYNEVVIEGGKLYIQTTPENFWTNSGAAGEKLIDIL